MAANKRRRGEDSRGHLWTLVFFIALCVAEVVMLVLLALGDHKLFFPVLAVGTIAGISLLMYLS